MRQSRGHGGALAIGVREGFVRRRSLQVRPGTVSRRCALGAGLGSALLAALPRPANAAPSATPTADGPWTFTDDHGTTVILPRRPERIVAHVGAAATLWEYGIRPVGIFGPLQREDGSREPLAGSIDLDAVTSVGTGWSEIDLEALVALQPDLIVGTTYSPGVIDDLWGLEPDVAAHVAQIAPMVAISVFETSVTESLARFEDLAASLGSDLGRVEIAAARDRFVQASEAVREAVAAKPGLTVLVMSAWAEAIYVANPAAASDLTYFQELGVDLVAPKNPDAFWEELSWEQALDYPADLILLDARDGGYTAQNLDEAPSTLAAHPAVKAGQVANWHTEFVLSYDAFAAILEELADAIRASRVISDGR